jgi:hypothetical protein
VHIAAARIHLRRFPAIAGVDARAAALLALDPHLRRKVTLIVARTGPEIRYFGREGSRAPSL